MKLTEAHFHDGPVTAGPATRKRVVANVMLTGYCRLVVELGADPEPLLREAGLLDSIRRGEERMIPLRAVGELLEKSARRLNCPDFGMRLADRQSAISLIKPLDRMIYNAPTIERSFRCTIDHMEAYTSGVRMSFVPDGERHGRRLRFELLLDDFIDFPQVVELLTLLSHQATIELSDGAVRSRAIRFAHSQVGSKWDYARRFSAPVMFDQNFDDICFTESDVRANVVRHDDRVFSAECERISAIYPPRKPDIRERVSQEIRYMLGEADCSREEVCRTIGMSTRTLHRKLTRYDTSFEKIRDEVRRTLCVRYLARGDLSITQVAGRLGFSEGSALTHACRKWFDLSPRELRRRLLQ